MKAWLEGVQERKGGREMETLSKSHPSKSSAVMGRIHRYYEMGQECFRKLEEKKKMLMGMIEPRGEETLQEKWRELLLWLSLSG